MQLNSALPVYTYTRSQYVIDLSVRRGGFQQHYLYHHGLGPISVPDKLGGFTFELISMPNFSKHQSLCLITTTDSELRLTEIWKTQVSARGFPTLGTIGEVQQSLEPDVNESYTTTFFLANIPCYSSPCIPEYHYQTPAVQRLI